MSTPFLRLLPISSVAVATLIVLVFVMSTFHSIPTYAEDTNSPVPPAAPLIVGAILEADHVAIHWQTSQAGTYPIKSYRVQRSDDAGKTYGDIATVTAASTSYDDPSGQTSSIYEVVADDDQDPVHSSPASDPIAVTASSEPTTQVSPSVTGDVTPATPAPTVTQEAIDIPDGLSAGAVMLQDAAQLDQQTDSDDQLLQAPMTDASSARIGQAGATRVAQLQAAINTNHVTLIQPLLNRFSYEKLSLYDQRDRLSATQQQQISQQCLTQTSSLETSLLSVPEPSQLDTITAIASCNLLIQQ